MKPTACLIAMLALPLALAACVPRTVDDDDADSSLCNGVRDLGEFETDDAFDADGDGYFDPSDPGCAETYSTDELDCDEEDELVNPGASEQSCNDKDDDCDPDTADENDLDADGYTDCEGDCDDLSQVVHPEAEDEPCDGVDADCNGEDGEPCDVDYTGSWTLTSTVSYSCGGGDIQVDFSAISITHVGDAVSVVPDGCPSAGCTGPTDLQGGFTSDNQFTAEQNMDPGGGCEQRFSMLATFTGPDAMNASLVINFVGAECGGMGCAGQNLAFAGTRD